MDDTRKALGSDIQTGSLRVDLIGHGAALGDLNNDDALDIVLTRSKGPPGGPSRLFLSLNSRQLRFTEQPDFDRFSAGRDVVGVALNDYDRDGDLDVFLACIGSDILLRNNGDATFEDVSVEAGVAGPEEDLSTTAIFPDVNNDGLPDLYVGQFIDFNEEAKNDPLSNASANLLYLNRGDGTFVDITESAGLQLPGASHTVAANDLNQDGRLELYVANDGLAVDGRISERLWPEDQVFHWTSSAHGVPTYDEVHTKLGLGALRSSMGIEFFDADADGRTDIYISDYGSNDLYLNQGDGAAFSENALAYSLTSRFSPGGNLAVSWGLLTLDLNRNGLYEMLIVNGEVSGSEEQAIEYLEQTTWGDYFAPIGPDPGFNAVAAPDSIDGARGVFRGDLDQDGDDDFVLGVNSGSFRVYRNETERQGRVLRMRLEGTVSAPDATGALVTAQLDDGRRLKLLRAAGGQPYGHGDSIIELPLGEASVNSLSVRWPSGYQQIVNPDQLVSESLALREPEWLTIEPRVLQPDSSASLRYVPHDDAGDALTASAPEQTVTVTASDGRSFSAERQADGTYTATIPHPGASGAAELSVSINQAAPLPIRPRIVFE